MGDISVKVSDGFFQIMKTMRIDFVDCIFYCFSEKKMGGEEDWVMSVAYVFWN
jgi:hypothetical protein